MNQAEAPANGHEIVIIIRPSFMKFCQDGCQSALLNHALYWIARKAKAESKEKIMKGEVYWYAKTEDIVKALADVWCEKKVRTEVNKLVEMGLLGRTNNPTWGADRTKFFFFGQDQCKKLLDLCEEHQISLQKIGLNDDVLHLVNMLIANGKYSKCKWSFYQMQTKVEHEASGKFTGAITKVITFKDTYIGKEGANDENQNDQSLSLTPEETLVLSWVKEQRVYVSEKDQDRVKGYCQKLTSMVKSPEDVQALCDLVREKQPPPDGQLNIGNLVHRRIVNLWNQRQNQGHFTQEAYVDQSVRLYGQDDADYLLNILQKEYPGIRAHRSYNFTKMGWGVFVELEDDIHAIYCAHDWQKFQDEGFLDQAKNYSYQITISESA